MWFPEDPRLCKEAQRLGPHPGRGSAPGSGRRQPRQLVVRGGGEVPTPVRSGVVLRPPAGFGVLRLVARSGVVGGAGRARAAVVRAAGAGPLQGPGPRVAGGDMDTRVGWTC